MRTLPVRITSPQSGRHAHVGSGEQVARYACDDAESRAAAPLTPGTASSCARQVNRRRVAPRCSRRRAPARRTAGHALGAVGAAAQHTRCSRPRPSCTRAEMARLGGDEHAATVTPSQSAVGWWRRRRSHAFAARQPKRYRWRPCRRITTCGVDSGRLRSRRRSPLVIDGEEVRSVRRGRARRSHGPRFARRARRLAAGSPAPVTRRAAPVVRARSAGRSRRARRRRFQPGCTRQRARPHRRSRRAGGHHDRDVRDLLGTSRKLVVPLVNRDAKGHGAAVTFASPGPRARPTWAAPLREIRRVFRVETPSEATLAGPDLAVHETAR